MSNEKRPAGDGYLERIADDVLLFKWIGTSDVDAGESVMAWMTEVMNEHGKAFLLIDTTDAKGITTRGRRHMVSYAKDQPFSGFVFFGASFQIRVVLNLIINALNLLRKSPQPMAFADNRDEAMAWIEAERTKLGAGS